MTTLRVFLSSIFFCTMTSFALSALAAEPFLVDQADSLDFEDFHKTNPADKNQPSLKEKIEAAISNKDGINTDRPDKSAYYIATTSLKLGTMGAIERIYNNMNNKCNNGWEKHREWAEKSNGELILHIAYTCR